MKADVKQKWVEALRSGQYEQGQKALKCDGKYCCLGVLCDVTGCEWLKDSDPIEYEAAVYNKDVYNSDNVRLPKNLITDVELTDVEESTLITLNDHENYDFNQIANFIETYL